MLKKESIARFFDTAAVGRDQAIEESLTVNYEQIVRQQKVLTLADFKQGDRVLDIGCGNGRDLSALGHGYPHISLAGVDFSPGMLREASRRLATEGLKGIELKVADACALPFDDNTFDLVICSEVIEHIPDYRLAIHEIWRVLCPGGSLIVTTPNWQSLYGVDRKLLEWMRVRRGKEPWDHEYDCWKTSAEVRSALRKHGFKIIKQVGACYLPGFIMFSRLPKVIQRTVIYFVGLVEPILSTVLPGFGYMIGFLARKD
ncbi:MAG TPA: methyltransferase domain-containing protein [Candidatus Aquicultor sp.]|jgi:ubiquinone/menaquinone biosynthesis C-methylase UbiE